MKYVSCENAADKEITRRNEFLEVPISFKRGLYSMNLKIRGCACQNAKIINLLQ